MSPSLLHVVTLACLCEEKHSSVSKPTYNPNHYKPTFLTPPKPPSTRLPLPSSLAPVLPTPNKRPLTTTAYPSIKRLIEVATHRSRVAT